jgi:hypothetical protein
MPSSDEDHQTRAPRTDTDDGGPGRPGRWFADALTPRAALLMPARPRHQTAGRAQCQPPLAIQRPDHWAIEIAIYPGISRLAAHRLRTPGTSHRSPLVPALWPVTGPREIAEMLVPVRWWSQRSGSRGLEPRPTLPRITMTVCPGSSGSCWGRDSSWGGHECSGGWCRCGLTVSPPGPRTAPGPRAGTRATGQGVHRCDRAARTRPWKRAETRGLEPRPWI